MLNIPLKTDMQNFEPEYVSIELEEETGEKYHLGALLLIHEDADGKGTDGVAIYFSQPTLAFMMTKEEALILAEDLANFANGDLHGIPGRFRRKGPGSDEYERVSS
jgi:hypothetical protein